MSLEKKMIASLNNKLLDCSKTNFLHCWINVQCQSCPVRKHVSEIECIHLTAVAIIAKEYTCKKRRQRNPNLKFFIVIPLKMDKFVD